MATYGTGLDLDEYYDFVIDESGDVASASELDELEKDLRGKVYRVISNYGVGILMNTNERSKLESRVKDTLTNDVRVLEADAFARRGDETDTLEMQIYAVTAIGVIEAAIRTQ